MEYKFKKGDFVKNIDIHDNRFGYAGIVEEEDDFPYVYWEDGELVPYDENKLEYNTFYPGDIVTINDKCRIEDLNRNHSNRCREDTFSFIKADAYTDNHLYKIDYIEDDNICVIDGKRVNSICLKLVSSQKKVREMTIEEISKELGYEVKIIKEE